MRTARRTILLILACAAAALLTGADRAPGGAAAPAMPGLRAAAPVLEELVSAPAPMGEIVSPTFPAWLSPAPLPQTPHAPARHEPVRLVVAVPDVPTGAGIADQSRPAAGGGGTMRRLVFALVPRVWEPSVDLSRPYLLWPGMQADGGQAVLATDPTAFWSVREALRAQVPLREQTVPFMRFSVPLPVEPGATIQSAGPAPVEPAPPRPLELLGRLPRQP